MAQDTTSIYVNDPGPQGYAPRAPWRPADLRVKSATWTRKMLVLIGLLTTFLRNFVGNTMLATGTIPSDPAMPWEYRELLTCTVQTPNHAREMNGVLN